MWLQPSPSAYFKNSICQKKVVKLCFFLNCWHAMWHKNLRNTNRVRLISFWASTPIFFLDHKWVTRLLAKLRLPNHWFVALIEKIVTEKVVFEIQPYSCKGKCTSSTRLVIYLERVFFHICESIFHLYTLHCKYTYSYTVRSLPRSRVKILTLYTIVNFNF